MQSPPELAARPHQVWPGPGYSWLPCYGNVTKQEYDSQTVAGSSRGPWSGFFILLFPWLLLRRPGWWQELLQDLDLSDIQLSF